MILTPRARRATRAYGLLACLGAYELNTDFGYGANTIAQCGPLPLRTTRQADAAIDAAREIRLNVLQAYRSALLLVSPMSQLPAYTYRTASNDPELAALYGRGA